MLPDFTRDDDNIYAKASATPLTYRHIISLENRFVNEKFDIKNLLTREKLSDIIIGTRRPKKEKDNEKRKGR